MGIEKAGISTGLYYLFNYGWTSQATQPPGESPIYTLPVPRFEHYKSPGNSELRHIKLKKNRLPTVLPLPILPAYEYPVNPIYRALSVLSNLHFARSCSFPFAFLILSRISYPVFLFHNSICAPSSAGGSKARRHNSRFLLFFFENSLLSFSHGRGDVVISPVYCGLRLFKNILFWGLTFLLACFII